MKLFAAILLGGVVTASMPALAQDDHHDDAHAPMHHMTVHRAHYRERYTRNYKSDQDEHQATEDLNRQYRGIPRSDAH